MENRPRHAKMLKKSSPWTLARRIMKLQKYTRLWELPPTFAMFYKLKMSQCIKIVFFFFTPVDWRLVGGLTWEPDCCGSLNSVNIHSQFGNKMKNGFHQTFPCVQETYIVFCFLQSPFRDKKRKYLRFQKCL